MMAMENANLISENTFSFSMAPFGIDSAIDFGAPKESRMSDIADMQWITLNDDYFWSVHCQGFALGSTTNSWAWGSVKGETDTISSGEVYSMFDTAASAIIFPKFYFEQVLYEIFNSMGGDEYELADGYVISKCYEDFPIVYFLFNDKWLAVDPADYVVDISERQDRSMCVLLLSQSDAAFFIMGLPVYMDYYTVHNDSDNRIGFVPRAGSNKETLQTGGKPTRVLESTDPADPEVSVWSWIISSLLVLSFMGIWVMIICGTIKNNRKNNVSV